MITTASRIRGGLYGLLVGDALGVPYEFHHRSAIPPAAEIEMVPPAGFERAHAGTPPGTWSDDGAQALVLLDSLLACGRLDLDHLAAGLVRWYDEGFMAVDGRVFDVGVQTANALRSIARGTPSHLAGPADVSNNGNGSLMRLLPLVLWHRGSPAELVADARRQSLPTHRHIRSQMCCALYALWGRLVLEGQGARAWDMAVAMLRGMYDEDTEERAELEFNIRPDVEDLGRGSGYVVDSLRSARDIVALGLDYEHSVRAAIALGDDTDTTACVTGGIVGLRDGVETIPARWMEALRGREVVEELLERVLELHATSE
jgi:ADP-ribosyl-[dinitrogen reductase] hydrolase